MGQEAEKAQRLKDFAGFQVTEAMCREGGANPDWKFMHCLPRHQEEVENGSIHGRSRVQMASRAVCFKLYTIYAAITFTQLTRQIRGD